MFGRGIVFVIPCYNAAGNLENLFESLIDQDDDRWKAVIIDDMSTDDTAEKACKLIRSYRLSSPPGAEEGDERITLIRNTEKKYALRNVVDVVKNRCGTHVGLRDTVAILDADDQLCNDKTVGLLMQAYEDAYINKEDYQEFLDDMERQQREHGSVEYAGSCMKIYDSTAIWTAHRWDINGMNISGALPENVNPYQTPWVTSHLKTFWASTLQHIPDSNFKDTKDEWFKRGYDQALYLPILARSPVRRYLPDVCYQYNINSVSMDRRDWSEMIQIQTVNLVRARGLLDE